MTKALEVSIDSEVVGVYVPPDGACFGVMVGNIPRTYMRAQVTSGTKYESWWWQLPDIEQGQSLNLRLVDAELGSGIPPQSVVKHSEEEITEGESRDAEVKKMLKSKQLESK